MFMANLQVQAEGLSIPMAGLIDESSVMPMMSESGNGRRPQPVSKGAGQFSE